MKLFTELGRAGYTFSERFEKLNFPGETLQDQAIWVQTHTESFVSEHLNSLNIHMYIKGNINGDNTYLKKNAVSIFLLSLTEHDMGDLFDGPIDKSTLTFCSELQTVLKSNAVPKEDIVHECEMLFDALLVSPHETPSLLCTAKESSSSVSLPLIIDTFRQKCGGRSWCSPNVYCFLYIARFAISLQSDEEKKHFWTSLPRYYCQHKKPRVLTYCMQTGSSRLDNWREIMSFLSRTSSQLHDIHSKVLHFAQYTGLDPEHPDIFQKYLTVFLPNWTEYWTMMAWSCRRKCKRLLDNYTQDRQNSISAEEWKKLIINVGTV